MDKKIKILLVTDFSEAVMNAERYAFQLALNINSSITVLHVYQSTVLNPITSIEPDKTEYTPGMLETDWL